MSVVHAATVITQTPEYNYTCIYIQSFVLECHQYIGGGFYIMYSPHPTGVDSIFDCTVHALGGVVCEVQRSATVTTQTHIYIHVRTAIHAGMASI